MLQGMFGKALLEPALKFKMTELQDICENGNEYSLLGSYKFLGKSTEIIVDS